MDQYFLISTCFFGVDYKPLPNTSATDRQRLMTATMKYKTNVENAEKRERAGKAKLAEIKAMVQKQSQAVLQTKRAAAAAATALKKKRALLTESSSSNRSRASITLREMDEASRASTRVKDVMTALSFTSQKRRDTLHLKRSSNQSTTWVQNWPGLNGPLRKSLWYKMHRRRQQIVLRPTTDYILSDLRGIVVKRCSEAEASGAKLSKTDVEKELMSAEQKFLLQQHPALPSGESISFSSSSDSWTEPGQDRPIYPLCRTADCSIFLTIFDIAFQAIICC